MSPSSVVSFWRWTHFYSKRTDVFACRFSSAAASKAFDDRLSIASQIGKTFALSLGFSIIICCNLDRIILKIVWILQHQIYSLDRFSV
jgi:serine acetyltransferase